ncbi:MAG: amino acid permease [Chlamydiota bacterium]
MNQTGTPSIWNIFTAMFLVAGTCIGGGMLALPVATSVAGFIPSSVILLLCWLLMTCTALLVLEVTLWMEPGAHFITLSTKILGRSGKWVAWIFFLFINYASLVAYIAEGGTQIVQLGGNWMGFVAPKWAACIVFSAIFGIVLIFGKNAAGRVNAILFVSLIVAYLWLVSLGSAEINFEYIMRQHWRVSTSLMMVPIMLTVFSFPGIVPSIVPYLKRNVKSLRIAVIGGTTLTFLIYMVWQAFVLGVVPFEGSHGLFEAFLNGEAATEGFRIALKSPIISVVALYFSFFAIVTSFLGIAICLIDFLADGFGIADKGYSHLLLGVAVVFPSLLLAIYFPRAFMVAMETTGGFGDAILSCLMPALMVWVGRYVQKRQGPYRVKGGKLLLIVVLMVSVLIFALEFIEQVWGITDFTDFR